MYFKFCRQLRKAVSIVEIKGGKKQKNNTRVDFLLSHGWGLKGKWVDAVRKEPTGRLAMRILEFCPLHLDALPFCLNEGYLLFLRRAQNFEDLWNSILMGAINQTGLFCLQAVMTTS